MEMLAWVVLGLGCLLALYIVLYCLREAVIGRDTFEGDIGRVIIIGLIFAAILWAGQKVTT